MRISTKCSLALHILVVIALYSASKKLTSELLSVSAGCNPVMIRNILGSLKKAGIIDIQKGAGGATLKLSPKDITIWTVYSAVDSASLDELIGLHPNPSSNCPIGRNIYSLLAEPYSAIGEAVKQTMSSFSLEQFLEKYKHLG